MARGMWKVKLACDGASPRRQWIGGRADDCTGKRDRCWQSASECCAPKGRMSVGLMDDGGQFCWHAGEKAKRRKRAASDGKKIFFNTTSHLVRQSSTPRQAYPTGSALAPSRFKYECTWQGFIQAYQLRVPPSSSLDLGDTSQALSEAALTQERPPHPHIRNTVVPHWDKKTLLGGLAITSNVVLRPSL